MYNYCCVALSFFLVCLLLPCDCTRNGRIKARDHTPTAPDIRILKIYTRRIKKKEIGDTQSSSVPRNIPLPEPRHQTAPKAISDQANPFENKLKIKTHTHHDHDVTFL